MERREIGKIQDIYVGFGGYDDAMLGIQVSLGGRAWSTHDFKGTWATKPADAQWTLEEQRRSFADVMYFVGTLLRCAKKKRVEDLCGVPIEATFDGNRLVSWRILEEVI